MRMNKDIKERMDKLRKTKEADLSIIDELPKVYKKVNVAKRWSKVLFKFYEDSYAESEKEPIPPIEYIVTLNKRFKKESKKKEARNIKRRRK